MLNSKKMNLGITKKGNNFISDSFYTGRQIGGSYMTTSFSTKTSNIASTRPRRINKA
jgi:hypothetical protein